MKKYWKQFVNKYVINFKKKLLISKHGCEAQQFRVFTAFFQPIYIAVNPFTRHRLAMLQGRPLRFLAQDTG